MRTIYRYSIPIRDRFTIELPFGARFLHAECQLRAPHEASMWFLVDTEQKPVKRTFAIVGTGNPAPDYINASEHLATFQMLVGAFVWHLFEVAS